MVKGLFDDRPPRASGEGKRARVLFVHGAFLARRGAEPDELLPEFSDRVWSTLLTKYPEHTPLVAVPYALEWMPPLLEERAVAFFVMDYLRVLSTSARMRQLLGELGVRLKTGTEREATIVNVERYVVSGEITRVGGDMPEYVRHGIDPDKELTVKESCAQRQASSKWSW